MPKKTNKEDNRFNTLRGSSLPRGTKETKGIKGIRTEQKETNKCNN